MKFSIFPKALAHPKGKDQKRTEAFKFSSPHLPQCVTATTEDELIEYITTNAWSPFVFDGVRDESNFVSTDLLVFDIDEGLSIDETRDIVKSLDLACLCLPSPSHTDEAQRFRVIFPLARTIHDLDTYYATWQAGAQLLKSVDPSCCDAARAYFGSTTVDGFWAEGSLFVPVVLKKVEIDVKPRSATKLVHVPEDLQKAVTELFGESRTKVSEAVEYFLRNAHTGLQGNWTNSLNRFCFSLSLSGVKDDVIIEWCEKLAPEELDEKDLYQIERALKDGKSNRL